MLIKLLSDERGSITVEQVIVTALLGAIGVLTFGAIRSGATSGANTISTKATGAVNSAGTISSW
ncbi:MAG: hypothetical protein HPY90_12120 [Syntrophothermus sp.]|uniref:hypothetical protein n=1 Tax=Syntrophothermus sp. TaxID=2736299 RepID=UPI002580BDF8|nr:hypothetical protein [Syntrophothermus sp.]NSW83995.1 hypothetical protein [Syntrophothermus sp.]